MAETRIIVFNPWADEFEGAAAYLERLPRLDISRFLAAGADERLRQMARLDCDWYGECVRSFAALGAPTATLPARVVGLKGIAAFAAEAARKPANETWWWVLIGHHPQKLGAVAGKVCGLLRKEAVRICLYAFDEASRYMPCFREIAPHLDILIHDESPLEPAGERLLRADCLRVHRSWVANVVPFAAPFNPQPEPKIVFLGSQLGLTPHRQRQIAFLRKRYGDRFVAIHDHSLAVGDRYSLNRYAVSLCPEGRKFTTPAMAATHTDRPFWSGCLGMVPVSEDSAAGGRLEELAAERLILRYAHGNLDALAARCDEALALDCGERRRIYDAFNRQETVGTVVAGCIADRAALAKIPA